MKITVIGATGMLGQPVTRQLVNAGITVKIIARNLTKARHLFPGCEVIVADLKDKASLLNALNGTDNLYLSLNTAQTASLKDWLPEREGLANVLEVAREVNVKRIGFLSSIVKNYQGMDGFNWWIFDVKQNAVEIVKSSGIPYFIFYPTVFMESFKGPYKIGRMIALAGKSEVKKCWIAGDDYGRQVAAAFKSIDIRGNKEYIIQGPDGYTDEQAADIYIANHRQQRLFKATMLEFILKFYGMFSKRMNYGYHIIHAINNYPEIFEASSTRQQLGTPTISLKQFAAENN